MGFSNVTSDHIARFWSKVVKTGPGECWGWNGAKSHGYGVLRVNGKNIYATRLSYWLHKESPEGRMVLHRCDNPECANPDHLFLGTHDDNMADMKAKGRVKRQLGIKHGMAKLTEEQARAIKQDTRRIVDIAREYGVSFMTVSNIRRGKNWKHI